MKGPYIHWRHCIKKYQLIITGPKEYRANSGKSVFRVG